jgi:zinc transporter ZupT
VLSVRLEDRLSIMHFAWAFGLGCVAFVMGGVAIKLFRDSITPPKVAFVLAGAAAIEVVVGLIRLNLGLRLYQEELSDFARMLTLRRELGRDQPRLPAA